MVSQDILLCCPDSVNPWTKGWFASRAGYSREWELITPPRAVHKVTAALFISGIFHWLLSACGRPRVTETVECKTQTRGRLCSGFLTLFLKQQFHFEVSAFVSRLRNLCLPKALGISPQNFRFYMCVCDPFWVHLYIWCKRRRIFQNLSLSN